MFKNRRRNVGQLGGIASYQQARAASAEVPRSVDPDLTASQAAAAAIGALGKNKQASVGLGSNKNYVPYSASKSLAVKKHRSKAHREPATQGKLANRSPLSGGAKSTSPVSQQPSTEGKPLVLGVKTPVTDLHAEHVMPQPLDRNYSVPSFDVAYEPINLDVNDSGAGSSKLLPDPGISGANLLSRRSDSTSKGGFLPETGNGYDKDSLYLLLDDVNALKDPAVIHGDENMLNADPSRERLAAGGAIDYLDSSAYVDGTDLSNDNKFETSYLDGNNIENDYLKDTRNDAKSYPNENEGLNDHQYSNESNYSISNNHRRSPNNNLYEDHYLTTEEQQLADNGASAALRHPYADIASSNATSYLDQKEQRLADDGAGAALHQDSHGRFKQQDLTNEEEALAARGANAALNEPTHNDSISKPDVLAAQGANSALHDQTLSDKNYPNYLTNDDEHLASKSAGAALGTSNSMLASEDPNVDTTDIDHPVPSLKHTKGDFGNKHLLRRKEKPKSTGASRDNSYNIDSISSNFNRNSDSRNMELNKYPDSNNDIARQAAYRSAKKDEQGISGHSKSEQVDLGAGLAMSWGEIESIAKKRVNPVLTDVEANIKKQQELDERKKIRREEQKEQRERRNLKGFGFGWSGHRALQDETEETRLKDEETGHKKRLSIFKGLKMKKKDRGNTDGVVNDVDKSFQDKADDNIVDDNIVAGKSVADNTNNVVADNTNNTVDDIDTVNNDVNNFTGVATDKTINTSAGKTSIASPGNDTSSPHLVSVAGIPASTSTDVPASKFTDIPASTSTDAPTFDAPLRSDNLTTAKHPDERTVDTTTAVKDAPFATEIPHQNVDKAVDFDQAANQAAVDATNYPSNEPPFHSDAVATDIIPDSTKSNNVPAADLPDMTEADKIPATELEKTYSTKKPIDLDEIALDRPAESSVSDTNTGTAGYKTASSSSVYERVSKLGFNPSEDAGLINNSKDKGNQFSYSNATAKNTSSSMLDPLSKPSGHKSEVTPAVDTAGILEGTAESTALLAVNDEGHVAAAVLEPVEGPEEAQQDSSGPADEAQRNVGTLEDLVKQNDLLIKRLSDKDSNLETVHLLGIHENSSDQQVVLETMQIPHSEAAKLQPGQTIQIDDSRLGQRGAANIAVEPPTSPSKSVDLLDLKRELLDTENEVLNLEERELLLEQQQLAKKRNSTIEEHALLKSKQNSLRDRRKSLVEESKSLNKPSLEQAPEDYVGDTSAEIPAAPLKKITYDDDVSDAKSVERTGDMRSVNSTGTKSYESKLRFFSAATPLYKRILASDSVHSKGDPSVRSLVSKEGIISSRDASAANSVAPDRPIVAAKNQTAPLQNTSKQQISPENTANGSKKPRRLSKFFSNILKTSRSKEEDTSGVASSSAAAAH